MQPRTTERTLTITTTTDLDIVMTRSFNAPAQLVYDAWTKPEHVRRWLLGPDGWEMDICEIDLRVGGAYRFHMRTLDGSEQMGFYGEYMELEAPAKLVCTELFEEPYFEEMGAGTINTLLFEESAGTTTMVASTLYRSKEARDRVLQSDMAEGAGQSFDRLEQLLASLRSDG